MSTPYRTPRGPHPPHPTPLSASNSKHLRAPTLNPYDKFPQADFDEWINGITGALKNALGQIELEPPPLLKQQSPQWISSQGGNAQLGYPPVDMYEGGEEEEEEVGNETFAEIKARRLGKGKARDPREGPGLQNGHRHEPIEIISSDEEDIDEVAQSIRIDEEDEETFERTQALEEDELLGEVRDHAARSENVFEYNKDEEEEEEEEEEDDDEEVEVAEPEGPRRTDFVEGDDTDYIDHENGDHHYSDEEQFERDEDAQHVSNTRCAITSQLWNNEEEDDGDESLEEDVDSCRAAPSHHANEGSSEFIELLSDDDEPQQDSSTPHRNVQHIAPPTAKASSRYDHSPDIYREKALMNFYTVEADFSEDRDGEEEEEEEEEDQEADGLEGGNQGGLEDDSYEEVEEDDGAENAHDASVSDIQGNDEILESQQTYDSSKDAEGSIPVPATKGQERGEVMLDEQQDVEDHEPEAMQPDDDNTSFSAQSARKGDDHVEIRDPWEDAQYYAEDLYTGGDKIAPDSNPHHLGTVDDEAVMDIEEIEPQPAYSNTAFPPRESTPDRTVEIPDQWRPLETFAEDFFSGGNVQLGQNPLDPSLLTGSADAVDARHLSGLSLLPLTTPPEIVALDESGEEVGASQNPPQIKGASSEDDDDIPHINVDVADGFSDFSEVNNHFTIIPPTPLMSSALSDFDPTSEGDLLSTFNLDVSQNAVLYSAHLQQASVDTASLPSKLNTTTNVGSEVMRRHSHQLAAKEKTESIDGDGTNGCIDMNEDVEEVLHASQSPNSLGQTIVDVGTGDAEEMAVDEQPSTTSEPHSGFIQACGPDPSDIEEKKSGEETKTTETLQMDPEPYVLNESEQDAIASPAEVSATTPIGDADVVQPTLDTQSSDVAVALIGGAVPEYEQLPTPQSEFNYLPSPSPTQEHRVEVEEVFDPEADIRQAEALDVCDSDVVQTVAPLEYTVSEAEEDQIDELDNDDAEGEDEGDDSVEILSVISSSDLLSIEENQPYEVEEPITEGRLTEEPSGDTIQDNVPVTQTPTDFADSNTHKASEFYEDQDTSGPPREEAASVPAEQGGTMTHTRIDHSKYDIPSELPGNEVADLFNPQNLSDILTPSTDHVLFSSIGEQGKATEQTDLPSSVVSPRSGTLVHEDFATTHPLELLPSHRQPSSSIITMSLTRKSTDPVLVADPFPASLSTPGISLVPDHYANDGEEDATGDNSLDSDSTADKGFNLSDDDFQYPPSPVISVEKPVVVQPVIPQLSEVTPSLVAAKRASRNRTPHFEMQTSEQDTIVPAHSHIASRSPVVNEAQNQGSSLNEDILLNSLKRKRGPSDATKEPTPVKHKGRKPRGKPRKSLSSPEKVEGDVIVVKPRPKTKPSVEQSWTPAKPNSSGTSISQKPDSFASSINSSARSERSLIMQASPTLDKPHITRLSPAPIVNLFHAHGQKKRPNYAPSHNMRPNPTRSITPVVDKTPREVVTSPSNTPGPSTLPHLPPTPSPVPLVSTSTSTPAHSAPPVPSSGLSAIPPAPSVNPPHPVLLSSTEKPGGRSPDPPAVTPAKHTLNTHAPVAPTSHTPVTRSHCRYHRISLPKTDDEGSPRVFFLVPGCSLTHPELLRQEEVQDHGEATQEDGARMIKDIDPLNFDSSLIGVLRQLVGVDILREQEVFYLPSPGDEVGRKQPLLKTFSDKVAMIRVPEGSNYSGSPGQSASPRPPVSVANSVSTTRSFYHKRLESDRGSGSPSVHSGFDDDIEEGASKRIRTSPAHVHQEVGSMGPPKLTVKKARRSGRIDATYEPDEDVNDEDEGEGNKTKGKRRRKSKKRGVKRTRTADTLEDDKQIRKPKKLKTHATMPASFATAPIDGVPEIQPNYVPQ